MCCVLSGEFFYMAFTRRSAGASPWRTRTSYQIVLTSLYTQRFRRIWQRLVSLTICFDKAPTLVCSTDMLVGLLPISASSTYTIISSEVLQAATIFVMQWRKGKTNSIHILNNGYQLTSLLFSWQIRAN